LFDVLMLAGFGALGFAMSRLKFPVAPLVLGFVLGDAMERALRQSLMMSQGDLSILISRPISAGMLIFAVAVLFLPLLPRFRRLKEAAG
jgi:putative tricarboxylic transport membrane protein